MRCESSVVLPELPGTIFPWLLEAEKVFMRDLPYIPILFYSSRALVSDKVAGWEDNLLDNHLTRWMSLN